MLRVSSLVLVVAAALVGTGCDAGPDSAPGSAARRFESALTSQDGDGACRLLTPETVVKLEESAGEPCARAILAEGLPAATEAPRQVEQYGTAAVARFRDDTVFLGRFRGGWRVTAAGCTALVDAPFSCTVEGS